MSENGEEATETASRTSSIVRELAGSPTAMASLAEALLPGLLRGLESLEATRAGDPTSQSVRRSSSEAAGPGNAAGSENSMTGSEQGNGRQGNGNAAGKAHYREMERYHKGFYSEGRPVQRYDKDTRGRAGSWGEGYNPPLERRGYYTLGRPRTFSGQKRWCSSSHLSSSSSEEEPINPFVDSEERSELFGSSEEEGEFSEEEPPPVKKARRMTSAETSTLLKAAFAKPLKNDKRKLHTVKYPLPSMDCIHTPKLDEDIACVIPKSAKTYDRYLSKMQQFTIDALGPLVWLSENVGSDIAREAVSSAICLIGNASSHLSTERRKSILKHLNNDLRSLGEGKFPDRGALLFGDGFGSKAKTTADNIKALKGIKPRFSSGHFSGSGGSNKGKEPQSRRYAWGKSASQNTVFARLGNRPSHPPDQAAQASIGRGNKQTSKSSSNKHRSRKRMDSSSIPATKGTSTYGPPAPKRIQLEHESAATTAAGRQNCALLRELGENGGQQVGAQHSFRLQTGTQVPANPVTPTSHTACSITDSTATRGAGKVDCKRSSQGGDYPRCARFLLNSVFGTKERWSIQTSDKSEVLKQVPEVSTFQDGGHARGSGSSTARGLVGTPGFERCIFFHPDPQPSPAVSEVPLAGQNIRVSMPSFRVSISSQSVYKGSTPGSCPVESTGNQMRDLPRRPPGNGSRQGVDKESDLGSSRPPHSPGLPSQLQEKCSLPGTAGRISGFPDRHLTEGSAGEVTGRKSEADSEGSRSNSSTEAGVCQIFGKGYRQVICGDTSSIPSTTPLPQPTGPEAQGSATGRLRWTGGVVSSSTEGLTMVEQQPEELEWPRNPGPDSEFGDRDGCITPGLGSIQCRRMHGRLLVPGGKEAPHQCSRVAGSNIWNQGLLQERECEISAIEDRQHYSGGLREQDGWNQVTRVDTSSRGAMGMVSGQTHQVESGASPREEEHQGRFSFPAPERSIRLDSGFRPVSDDQQQIWSSGSRSFCNQILSTSHQVLQLETRPFRGRGGCLHTELVSHQGLRKPSLVPHCQGAAEGTDSGGDSSDGGTLLANSSLVPKVGRNAGGCTNPVATRQGNTISVSQLRLPNSRPSATVDRLQGLRLRFQTEGISEEAISLILSSWRSKTDANYDSAWRKWQRWCNDRNTNPFCADLSHILGFLAAEFKEGKQYRSLNCFRSAISSAHLPIEGFMVGKHPLVCRLLKGVFNLRPPQPKYSQTWEVTRVTAYLKAIGNNDALSLKQLTLKLAMLMALALASRSSGLARLTVTGLRFIPEGVELVPRGLAKQARPGKEHSQKPIMVPRFQDAELCPVQCLEAYMGATREFRVSSEFEKVFLSFTVLPA